MKPIQKRRSLSTIAVSLPSAPSTSSSAPSTSSSAPSPEDRRRSLSVEAIDLKRSLHPPEFVRIRRNSKDLREHRHHFLCERCGEFAVSAFILERDHKKCIKKKEEEKVADPVYETLDAISVVSSFLSVL